MASVRGQVAAAQRFPSAPRFKGVTQFGVTCGEP